MINSVSSDGTVDDEFITDATNPFSTVCFSSFVAFLTASQDVSASPVANTQVSILTELWDVY